ncbi:MAG: DUF2273 domain-containing protein [Peptoniphilaceae bacterium]|nr:DUF2273 domain-containing protein [Peptoniphilaceae bacterium]MDD7383249.1 DUF2273 domain-containing protein [Peptoniphilaceae bacterium]MDY3737994.1 DUF2273 domain-containing protein [Peptoniphilaceae bacterium]
MMENKNEKYDSDIYEMYKLEIARLKRRKERNQKLKKYWFFYKYRIIYMFIALITSISLLNIGFLKTLLIWILMLIGFTFGSWKDGNVKTLKKLIKFFKKY